MENIYQKVLSQIIFVYTRYSTEHRANTQPFHLQKIQNQFQNYQYNCKDLVVREPLIEHSGSLPIIATTIYPYIKNKNVDLGTALIMLAIHDIGELITGDEITFTKKESQNEKNQALKLLPKQFHSTYLEMENLNSDTAKFAKAIDKMTPDIIDLITLPEVTIKRYKILVNKNPDEIIPLIKEYKHHYMIWNNFLKNLHLEILNQLDQKLQPYL
ncbi:MAG: HD domain-containing protein [Candidatus Shapirobacteria bacterium]|nr:HD domain-containing protein [Candidatus Shapirobacteria bacterium]